MEAVECLYRGKVIGWLIEGPDGFLTYCRKYWRSPVFHATNEVKIHKIVLNSAE